MKGQTSNQFSERISWFRNKHERSKIDKKKKKEIDKNKKLKYAPNDIHIIESGKCIIANNLINSLNYFLKSMNPVNWSL